MLGEGTHFKVPWLHRPYIFNVRSTPRNIKSLTGSRGEARERDSPCMPYHAMAAPIPLLGRLDCTHDVGSDDVTTLLAKI